MSEPVRMEVRDITDPSRATYILELDTGPLHNLQLGAVISGRVVEIRRQVVER